MSEQSDILVEIADDQLPKLARLYQERATWAPYMVGFVHTGMKWKASAKYGQCVKFYSPENCWEEDGTIIVLITGTTNRDVSVFTLDDKCTNLYKGLSQTKILNLFDAIRTCFYAIHEKHTSTVHQYLDETKIQLTFITHCYFYAVSPEEARTFTVECPPDVEVKKLRPSDAPQICKLWPHKFKGCVDYLQMYIEVLGGYGVYLKSTNELAAWIIKHQFGHFAILQTEEAHQRKGYASLIVKAISKEIGEEGHWPLGTILINNNNSINMFKKMGFRSIGRCSFFGIEADE